MPLFNVVTKTVELLGNRFTREDKNSINVYRSEWARLGDDALQVKLREAAQGINTLKPPRSRGIIALLFSLLPRFLHRKNPITLNNIALAVEAFNRMPADLPTGSRLFPQQVQAAIALVQRCLIQMDTGEGKTYALLPAAFALACEHQRVYIVCANEYLAWRDANRTRPFWEFVGLPPGLCLEQTPDSNWSQRVIYTTLEWLVFRQLKNTLSQHKPDYPLLFGSVLLDEADAILLDQAVTPFTVVQNINSTAFDWTLALDYAGRLVEKEDILTEFDTLNASLTLAGEQRVREFISAGPASGTNYLLTRYAVEIAYVALKAVEEERDYVVEGDRVYAIDRVTGKVQRNVTPRWVVPLEFMRGFASSPERITLDSISPVTVLKKFRHIAGMSGTIADDALEYLFTYFLPTQIIQPRKKRFPGLRPDLLFITKKESAEELCSYALEQLQAGRPVLIGTQTILDAEMVYRKLLDQLPPGSNLRLLTGKNDRDAAEIFARGGEVGSLIIATQLAGRGVDIRLDDDAKLAGGLVLLSLGRSLTVRYDKQFTGRAGRQGDPFEARFFCSYDDELIRRLVGEKTKRIMKSLGQEEGVSIDSKMVSKRILGAQQRNRQFQFLERRQSLATNVAHEQIRESIEAWFDYLQLPYVAEPQNGNKEIPPTEQCSNVFLERVVDYFIEGKLSSLLKDKRDISEEEAEEIVRVINKELALEGMSQISSFDIVGHNQESATNEIRAALFKRLDEALARYWKLRKEVAVFYSAPASVTDGTDGEQPPPALPLNPDQYRKIVLRTPRSTAYWSLLSCWIEFQQEAGRIRHRASSMTRSNLEFFRALTDRTLAQWEKSEGLIAPRVLMSLTHCDQPWTNDDIFLYEDNRSYDYSTPEAVSYDWETTGRTSANPVEKDEGRLLVHQFIAQSDTADKHLTKSQLIRLLDDFIHSHPLHTLRTPAQVQTALEEVISDQIATGVGEQRRQTNKKWLRLFLIFLRDRKLIGPLPTFQHRIKSVFAQSLKNLTETKTTLTVGGVVVFIVVFGLLTHFGRIATPTQLDTFGTLVDAILFGRLLAAGAITAPAFGVLLLAGVLLSIIFPAGVTTVKGVGPDRIIVFALQIFFAIWLTPWSSGGITIGPVISSSGIFLSILIIARITQKVVWWVENDSGLSLTSGWLSYCVLLIVIPLVVNPYPGAVGLLIGFLAAVLTSYASQQFNKTEIELASKRLVRSERSMKDEDVFTSETVDGSCGSIAHIYAILISWISYEVLNRVTAAQTATTPKFYITAAIYLLTTCAYTTIILRKRFLPRSWASDLNRRHQAIKDVEDEESLKTSLRNVRNKLLARELIAQSLLIIAVTVLLRDYMLLDTGLPLGIFIVFCAYVFADHSRRFLVQLYRLVISRVPYSTEALDLSNLVVPDEHQSLPNRIKHFFEQWIGVIITVGLALIEGVDFVKKAWHFLAGFFGSS